MYAEVRGVRYDLKKFFLRFLCVFGAAGVLMSCLSFGVLSPANADEPVGKMASVYGYILNDYIESYGVMSTNAEGILTDSHGELINPGGIIYGDVMNFDRPGCPYLVIFLVDNERRTAACHMWMYDDATEQAERIAIIERKLDDIPDTRYGEISMEWGGGRQYITYREYDNYLPITEEFYTAINGDAFMLVNKPADTSFTGIIGFNAAFVISGVDISDYNKNLDVFFSKLKDTASDSVSYADVAYRLSDKDKDKVTKTLINAALYDDLDVLRFTTAAEYSAALNVTTSGSAFTNITSFYDLGDGIFYSQFDTDKTKYNYAILRKSDEAENGYQILKSRLDAIPLSDRELRQMKAKYLESPLIYSKSDVNPELMREEKSAATDEPDVTPITVTVGGETVVIPIEPAETAEPEIEDKRLIEPIISLEKVFDDRVRFPAACIGGGITAALVTMLWVYMFSGDE